MKKFLNTVKNICKDNKNVAMFIDMDGTITVYDIHPTNFVAEVIAERYTSLEPLECVIDVLKEISSIPNIDLYILSLSKAVKITKQKKVWLKKYVPFIPEENWIILTKELDEYNFENRNIIKAEKIKEKMSLYDHSILLDDDHTILKAARQMFEDKIDVFHISSALV